eukprot:505641-Amphidinium_carterae.1
MPVQQYHGTQCNLNCIVFEEKVALGLAASWHGRLRCDVHLSYWWGEELVSRLKVAHLEESTAIPMGDERSVTSSFMDTEDTTPGQDYPNQS